MTGAELIAAERQRQIEVEGWTREHDDEHDLGELAWAAATYALPSSEICVPISMEGDTKTIDLVLWLWPSEWGRKQYKPSDERIKNLMKAGALIAAEIDRIQRIAGR